MLTFQENINPQRQRHQWHSCIWCKYCGVIGSVFKNFKTECLLLIQTVHYYIIQENMHIITVYENGTQQGLCYLWGQCDGRKECLEITRSTWLWLGSLQWEVTWRSWCNPVLWHLSRTK
jgi:hypothetical protein